MTATASAPTPAPARDPRYDAGFDDGYRSGLQKARDAIKSGDLATRAQMDELRSVITQTARELSAQLQVVSHTGDASGLIDVTAGIDTRLTSLTKDFPS